MIILITKLWSDKISLKFLFIILIVQISLWVSFVREYSDPFINREELNIIKTIAHEVPKDINMVTLT